MARGIVDLQKKVIALKILTGASNLPHMCRTIMETYDTRIPGYLRKGWNSSRPTQKHYLDFFESVLKYVGWAGGTSQVFFDCTYEEFVEHMSPARRLALTPRLQRSPLRPFQVHVPSYDAHPETTWRRENVVDQKYMYTSEESVRLWNGVLISGRYDSYGHCEDCLDAFLKSEYWLEQKLPTIGTICILGAGATSKDVAIINSCIDHGLFSSANRLKLIIYDYSHSMMMDCFPKIEGHVERQGFADQIEIHPIEADFMEIHVTEQFRTLDDERATAFFLLGGTLGNLQEDALVQALRSASSPGDVFVLSGDFVPREDATTFKDGLVAAYDTPQARDLALVPVRRLLDDAKVSRSDEDRRKLVEVKLSDGVDLPVRLRSTIPGTLSVSFSLTWPERRQPLHLVVSKKYDEEALTTFMARHDFNARSVKDCHGSKSYKLLAFERGPA